jgi:hypothetical protein
MVLASVDLYDYGPDISLAVSWTRAARVRMDTVEKLAKLKASAVPDLLDAIGTYAILMRGSASVELGIHPSRPTYIQSRSEMKRVNEEIRRRLRSGWPNLCHGAALTLTKIGGDAVEPTIAAVRENDWLAAIELVWALGEIGDKRAGPLLRRIFAWWNVDQFPEVKQMAKRPIMTELHRTSPREGCNTGLVWVEEKMNSTAKPRYRSEPAPNESNPGHR